MGVMPVGCYMQMSAIKEGVIMRLQCILRIGNISIVFICASGSYEDDIPTLHPQTIARNRPLQNKRNQSL